MIVQGPQIAEWVMTKSGGQAHSRMVAMGWMRDDKLIAGFAFENWTGKNVMVHQRHDATATKGFWKAVADYIFVTLNCDRMTASIGEKNVKSLKLTEHIGCKEEARLKGAGPQGEDLVLMVLWKDNCKMLNW